MRKLRIQSADRQAQADLVVFGLNLLGVVLASFDRRTNLEIMDQPTKNLLQSAAKAYIARL